VGGCVGAWVLVGEVGMLVCEWVGAGVRVGEMSALVSERRDCVLVSGWVSEWVGGWMGGWVGE
jgi:hypothetical protein